MPPAPSPVHLLRQHRLPITALFISEDNRRIYAGDSGGNVSITLSLTLRQIAHWKPHASSVLGVQPWGDKLITHGRDNKLLIWQSPEDIPSITEGAVDPNLETPTLVHTLDVNALNYCRFSLCEELPSQGSSSPHEALVAIPNLLDSSLADVWRIPSCDRPHASIGMKPDAPIPIDSRGEAKTGIIMSLHLYFATDQDHSRLHLLAGYESGSLILRRQNNDWRVPSLNSVGWETLWEMKYHKESIMAMAVSPTLQFALSTSSEHLLIKYALAEHPEENGYALKEPTVFRMKWPGNGSIAIRKDGRVCAVGGWDGKIRLFSTNSGKSLGTLDYHKGSCQALVFAHQHPGVQRDSSDFDTKDLSEMEHWLIGGGKDSRISIWKLMEFDKKQ